MPKITGELCATRLSSISDLGYLRVTPNKIATISASVIASKLKGRILRRVVVRAVVFSLGSFFHGPEGHTSFSNPNFFDTLARFRYGSVITGSGFQCYRFWFSVLEP